ncbi:MAG: Peptidase family M50 [Syntrophorhabdaceae bacterium PtaU1.Bin034]|nr:MAG: Peptidase family M50 [Syntrophorhabdaceae bacterium PtaU1.Bin034]
MKKRGLLLHITLFLLTILTTYYAQGALYSVSVMAILLSHEMGHYIASRRYGVAATLPYFIPFPLSPFGTFGAVIKMGGIITDRKALFDIGVAGPICGFILAVPCVLIGVKLSTAVKVTAATPYLMLGDPLLFQLVQWLVVGDLPSGYGLLLHPVAYAGWVGLFVTALNLLPIGQLDGGHVVYAVFRDRSQWVFRVLIAVLLLLSVVYSVSWVVLALLLLAFGIRHPEPLDPDTPLDGKRKWLAVAVLLIFILSFVPAPFAGNSMIELIRKLFAS